ncbi:MAG: pentapeptide repeat-containing protein [Colwellia sp.]
MSHSALNRVEHLNNGQEQSFKFNGDVQYALNFSDFKSSKLTGDLTKVTEAINKNFESCALINLTMLSQTLEACDFLDSTMNSCKFEKCYFEGTHFYSCMIFDSSFINVKISLTNFSENYFEGCTFINCEFSRFIFKKCDFINCTFINCTTTNKLFELCYFNQTSFEKIELQIETIIDNLGIRLDLCSQVQYRTARTYEEYEIVSQDELREKLLFNSKSGLSLIASNYFLFGLSEGTYNSIMHTLDSTEWLKSRVSSSVAASFTTLAKFLIGSYNNQEMILLPLIKFQDYLNELTQLVSSQSEHSSFVVIQTLNGLRMQVSQYTCHFVEILGEYEKQMNEATSLSLDCRGPAEVGFFSDIFEHIREDIRVDSVRVRNSPLDVIVTCISSISCWFVLSAILSTRYKESLTRYSTSSKKMQSLPLDIIQEDSTNPLIVHRKRTIGPLNTKDKDIGFQVVTLYNNGLCKKLHLGFSFKRAMEINKHVLGIRKSFSEDGTEL